MTGLRRAYRLLGPALLAYVLLSPRPAGATERFGDIQVTAISLPLLHASHGYMDHRLRIANLSPVRSHLVRVRIPNRSYAGGERIERIERILVLSPGASATVSLLQPPLPMYGGGSAAVDIDNRYAGVVDLPSLHSAFSAHQTKKPCALVSRRVNSHDLELRLREEFPPRQGAGHGSSHSAPGSDSRHHLVRGESEVGDWSDHWLAYTCFDGLVVTSEDMREMPADVRLAVWRYVEAGGSLFVMGGCEIPSAWRSRRTVPAEGLESRHVGFGQCLVCNRADVGGLTKDHLRALARSWSVTQSPWGHVLDVQKGQQRFPVVENVRVPVRGLFFVMLGFAVLIGPVNLIALSRIGRKMWLLWTVPAVSAVACMVVFVYSLFAEGITPTVRLEGLTVLDETSRRATTLGLLAVYCPLTPGGGLRFGHETEITPQVETGSFGGGSGRRMSWTRDQHLISGWVTARVPSYFKVRKSELRRERLQVIPGEDGGLAAVNGLGAPIVRLWVADAEGRIHSAADVAPGERVALTAGNARAAAPAGSLRQVYKAGDWSTLCALATDEPAARLSANTYLAVLDGCPFLKSGLAGRSRKKTKSAVFGIRPHEEG